MKALKGLLLFAISLVLVTACFNPPEMGTTPNISLKDLYFRVGQVDTLIFVVDFKDGDGNMGLSGDMFNPPYHDRWMYLGNNGDTTSVAKATLANDPLGRQAIYTDGATGKLLTVRSRKDPAYSWMPVYLDGRRSCTYYDYDSVYVIPPDKGIFDNSYNIVDTLTNGVFVLLDTFYYRPNPNHFNFDVRVYNADGSEFNWYKEYCAESPFKGRFPVLSEDSSPLEGTITFSAQSAGLRATFGARPLTFRIAVRDRDLNTSNIIEVGPITLEELTRD